MSNVRMKGLLNKNILKTAFVELESVCVCLSFVFTLRRQQKCLYLAMISDHLPFNKFRCLIAWVGFFSAVFSLNTWYCQATCYVSSGYN